MLLGRSLDDKSTWLNALSKANGDPQAIAPEAFRSFIPTDKDKSFLSVYAMESLEDATLVASAFRFNMGDISSACHFAVVEMSQLTDLGILVQKSEGATYHPFVNDRHYEVQITSISTLIAVVSQFSIGRVFTVEKAQIKAGLEKSAANDQIDLDKLSVKPGGNVAVRTLELVNSKHLRLLAGGG